MAGRPRSNSFTVSKTTTRTIELHESLVRQEDWADGLKLTLVKREEGKYILVPEGQTLETA